MLIDVYYDVFDVVLVLCLLFGDDLVGNVFFYIFGWIVSLFVCYCILVVGWMGELYIGVMWWV